MIRFGLLLLLLMVPAIAHAECQRKDRDALAREGYGTREIAEFCDLDQEDFPAPAAGTASYCETDDSFCPLAAPLPTGSGCSCATQYGLVPGVAE